MSTRRKPVKACIPAPGSVKVTEPFIVPSTNPIGRLQVSDNAENTQEGPLHSGSTIQLGNNGTPAGGDAVGVDKIRDLLFGNQMQDYDRRFSKLEERFLQRLKDIEAETARNLSAFESSSKKQT